MRLLQYLVLVMTMNVLLSPTVFAKRYGERYCDMRGYHCIKVKRGDTWASLWPDEEERDVVQRLNRMNVRLKRGMVVAVPNNLYFTDMFDISPLPHSIESDDEKLIIVNQRVMAWGAYQNGRLKHWGPISSGKNYCADVGRGCRTPAGEFRMYTKKGAGCRSSKYPTGRGGAKMPHCMFFHRGYAMHGSPQVPGYRASHGCIRLFNRDAEWLNTEFIDLPRGGKKGTPVIIKPL